MSFTSVKTKPVSISFKNHPTLTEQSHKDICDIHRIVRKSIETGVCEHTNQHEGQYLDLPDSTTYHEYMNRVAEVNSMFQTVPTEIRADFQQSPAKFVEFMQNPKNKEKIAEYGFSTAHFPVELEGKTTQTNPNPPNPQTNPNPPNPKTQPLTQTTHTAPPNQTQTPTSPNK